MNLNKIFLLLSLCIFSSAALAAWYGGGSYDGYGEGSAREIMGWTVVDNASGATNILTQSAWLNGTCLDTGGTPAVVYVYYGVADGDTNKTLWSVFKDFGNCTNDQALSTNVTGLTQGTAYYYRFYITNTAGDEAWANSSANFVTFSAPILDNEPGAMPVSFTMATLNGNLAEVSGASVINIYWGQDTNNWANTNSLGSLLPGAFHAAITGLTSGTAYYYRSRGTNDYGEGWSEIAGFTTRSPEFIPAAVTTATAMVSRIRSYRGGKCGSR